MLLLSNICHGSVLALFGGDSHFTAAFKLDYQSQVEFTQKLAQKLAHFCMSLVA